jgi:hypothetical protein
MGKNWPILTSDGPVKTQAANLKSAEAVGGWFGKIKPKFATAAWTRSLKTR